MTRPAAKAARVATLFLLGDLVTQFTLQELADVLHVGHRSTILRDLETVAEVRRLYPTTLANLLDLLERASQDPI